MEESVTLLAAFGAGVLSFVSPCILPFIPSYLSYVSVRSSPAFVLGFSIVFVTLGASATLIGQLSPDRLAMIGRLAGLIVIIFGLHALHILPVRVLQHKKHVRQVPPARVARAMSVGMAFAFGWMPCIGPTLAGIFALAGVLDTVAQSARLLLTYSLGLAVPFLATSLVIGQFVTTSAMTRRIYRVIEATSGALLILIGVLIVTDQFAMVSAWLTL